MVFHQPKMSIISKSFSTAYNEKRSKTRRFLLLFSGADEARTRDLRRDSSVPARQ